MAKELNGLYLSKSEKVLGGEEPIGSDKFGYLSL